MNTILLSRIAKDFLNQDAETVPPSQLYRMAWGGSSVARRSRRPLSLSTLKEKFTDFLGRDAAVFRPGLFSGFFSTSPKLVPPRQLPPGSYQLPRYFSRGAADFDKKRNPAPIFYLLMETSETAQPRPVPGNSLLLRSLCKGKGILKQNKQGLVYLDIDNRFISSMIPYLKAYGLVKPPYFNLFGSPDGAHIPVVPAREAAFQYLEEIAELGKEYSFEIEGLYSLEPSVWPEVEQVWFFKLRSPELERFRQRHFLPAVPGGHPFHIAVAVKPQTGTAERSTPLPPMRVNVGVLAA